MWRVFLSFILCASLAGAVETQTFWNVAVSSNLTVNSITLGATNAGGVMRGGVTLTNWPSGGGGTQNLNSVTSYGALSSNLMYIGTQDLTGQVARIGDVNLTNALTVLSLNSASNRLNALESNVTTGRYNSVANSVEAGSNKWNTAGGTVVTNETDPIFSAWALTNSYVKTTNSIAVSGVLTINTAGGVVTVGLSTNSWGDITRTNGTYAGMSVGTATYSANGATASNIAVTASNLAASATGQTNNMTSIVYSNPALFASTNLLSATSNTLATATATAQSTANSALGQTNAMTSIVYSNPAQFASTNLLNATSNTLSVATATAQANANTASNLAAVAIGQTNGMTGIVYSNAAVFVSTNLLNATSNTLATATAAAQATANSASLTASTAIQTNNVFSTGQGSITFFGAGGATFNFGTAVAGGNGNTFLTNALVVATGLSNINDIVGSGISLVSSQYGSGASARIDRTWSIASSTSTSTLTVTPSPTAGTAANAYTNSTGRDGNVNVSISFSTGISASAVGAQLWVWTPGCTGNCTNQYNVLPSTIISGMVQGGQLFGGVDQGQAYCVTNIGTGTLGSISLSNMIFQTYPAPQIGATGATGATGSSVITNLPAACAAVGNSLLCFGSYAWQSNIVNSLCRANNWLPPTFQNNMFNAYTSLCCNDVVTRMYDMPLTPNTRSVVVLGNNENGVISNNTALAGMLTSQLVNEYTWLALNAANKVIIATNMALLNASWTFVHNRSSSFWYLDAAVAGCTGTVAIGGSIVYLDTIQLNGGGSGVLNISIDGVSKTNVTAQPDAAWSSRIGNTVVDMPLVFSNLSATVHSVTFTNSGTATPVYVQWAAGWSPSESNTFLSRVYAGTTAPSTTNAYATAGAPVPSYSYIPAVNTAISNAVNICHINLGLPVFVVPLDNYYPYTMTADGTHPNAAGVATIVSNFQTVINQNP